MRDLPTIDGPGRAHIRSDSDLWAFGIIFPATRFFAP